MRVLLVEDEKRLAETVAKGLRRHGYAVDVAHDGTTGLDRALVHDYDVVVLDRDLPGLHGDDVCRELDLAGHRARVLMLTAAASLDQLVTGFEVGADDYLAKPFAFAELLVRLHALGRRGGAQPSTVLRHDDLVVDSMRGSVTRGGEPVDLTARELAVLVVLLRAEGAIVSAETILEKAWDEHADPFTSAVRVIISRLRSKLGEPALITTVVGQGYRL